MGVGRSGDEHLQDWAGLHRTEAPTGFVAGWVRAAAAVARPLARAGISANTVTVAALVAAVVAVAVAGVDGWPGPTLACVAVTVSGLLDSLDGAVAVQAGCPTKVGFLLDSALDRVADVAFCAALAIVAAGSARAAVTGGAAWVAVAAVAAAWWLEYVRARAGLAEADVPGGAGGTGGAGGSGGAGGTGEQVITPGERPTRIVLTAIGLGLPPLALAALWGQVVIVGGSGVFLLVHFLRRLHRHDARPSSPPGAPPTPTP
ncbi:MAG: CDP-alcohol phosphatidyltransferase family protein [Acidimicrobiales bacterium]